MKIQIKGTQTIVQQIPVDISMRDAAEAVCSAILRNLGIPADSYTQAGKIVTWDSARGGSGITTIQIEHPTLDQVQALDTCRELIHLVTLTERAR